MTIHKKLWAKYLSGQDLNLSKMATDDLEDVMHDGCQNRDFSFLMHQVAKELELRKSTKRKKASR